MRVYNEEKLRKKLSILRFGKIIDQLNEKGKEEIVLCEMLLDSMNKNRKKNFQEFDNWLEELGNKNGTTKY